MPANTTVSHVSPLLNYIPRSAWYEASVENGPDLLQYTTSGYHYTNATNGAASVSFSWWGNGIWIYGGYTRSLGSYRVTLDSRSTDFPGYTGGAEHMDYLLFGASYLSTVGLGPHNIRIDATSTDPSQPLLSIGYLVFENGLVYSSTIYHNSSDCVWRPESNQWQIDTHSHTTTSQLGAMGLNFTGAGVALYGTLYAGSAPFSVTIDGHTRLPLTPNTALDPWDNATTLLYVETGLDQGEHTLWVENNPLPQAGGGTKMSLSYGMVFSADNAANGTASGPSLQKVPATAPNVGMSPNSAAIFGASFGALGVILLGVLIWQLALLRMRRAARQTDETAARPFLSRASHRASSSSSAASGQWRSQDPTGTRERPPRPGWFARTIAKAAPVAAADEPDSQPWASTSRGSALRPLELPTRQQSRAGTTAGYSVAGTPGRASLDGETLWSPDTDGDGPPTPMPRGRRSIEKAARRQLLASGATVPSLPSARVRLREPPPPPPPGLQMEHYGLPPPYRILDMH